MGGEEFAILLPETTRNAAAQAAERLRNLISGSGPTAFEQKVDITVSIGVASYSASMWGAHALLRQADQALYAAKNSGRNKVKVATDPDVEISAAAE
jgi:diguanylate cyclase (GGDEF)-like protein